MPHDRKGNVLQAGDIVSIPARVMSVHEGEEYCNVSLETLEVMPPYSEANRLSLNTRQVELVAAAAEPEAEAPASTEMDPAAGADSTQPNADSTTAVTPDA